MEHKHTLIQVTLIPSRKGFKQRNQDISIHESILVVSESQLHNVLKEHFEGRGGQSDIFSKGAPDQDF